jgi:hypothetical protein
VQLNENQIIYINTCDKQKTVKNDRYFARRESKATPKLKLKVCNKKRAGTGVSVLMMIAI